MADTDTIGSGVYTLTDASRLLGLSTGTLLRWAERSSHEPPLLTPTHGWAYSFHDLVSLAVIGILRVRGIKRAGARRAIEYLQQVHHLARPLADQRIVEDLATADQHVLWQGTVDIGQSGQLTLIETLRSHLIPIEYGSDLLARLWRPAPSVVLDPQVQAGRPCVEGTRVTTDVIADRVAQGESISSVTRDLRLTRLQVTRSVAFEKSLGSGHGLARVAA